jgi:hypothetical protein
MAHLRRIPDGVGDSGSVSLALGLNDEGTDVVVKGNRPIVGCLMQVGSLTARSYSHQDYWTTSKVTEILEETEDYVKFKTENSIYEWRR